MDHSDSPTLPYDIWDAIAKLLPPKHLKPLYSVNRGFFHMSMKARYRELYLDSFDDQKIALLRHLRDPFLAGLVQTINLDTWAIFTSHCARGETIFTSEDIIRAIAHAIHGMHNVSTFNVQWGDTIFSHDLVPLFNAAWKAFGNSIQTLKITASLQRLPIILAAGVGQSMTCLQHLTLIIRDDLCIPCMSKSRVQTLVLAPFIKGLKDSLLSFVIRSTTDSIDLSPLFTSIATTTFPRMIKIDLKVSPSQCGLTLDSVKSSHDFFIFLQNHAGYLENFAWSALPTSSPRQISADIDLLADIASRIDTILPSTSLHSLAISLADAQSLPPIFKHIESMTQLHQLSFDGMNLSFENILHIVDVLVSTPLTITSLRLDLAEFSERVVAVLGRLSHCLVYLGLHIHPEAYQMPATFTRIPDLLSKTSLCKLRELEIRGYYFCLTDLRVTLDIFDFYFHSFKTNSESLTLDLCSLRPQVIDYLSSLRSLRSLWLCITEVCSEWGRWPDATDIWTGAKEFFAQDMATRRYSDWTTLECVQLTSKCWNRPNELHQLMDHRDLVNILAKCIPSIQID